MEINKVYHGDCLELMDNINDKSIDMILCDLPYNTTACHWDKLIPFEPLWRQYERIIKDNGAIVLTASQPFTTDLINSNRKFFKYEWIWDKTVGSNIFHATKVPLKTHENILIFNKGKGKYYPLMTEKTKPQKQGNYKNINTSSKTTGTNKVKLSGKVYTHSYPKTILTFKKENRTNSLHPTQKPVALFEYLIKTYTNEGDTVLDNAAGSGTTGIACINTNRNYILIEKEEKYYGIIKDRIRKHTPQLKLIA